MSRNLMKKDSDIEVTVGVNGRERYLNFFIRISPDQEFTLARLL